MKKLIARIKKLVEKVKAFLVAPDPDEMPDVDPARNPTEVVPSASPTDSFDEVVFSSLDFCWGGFDGHAAKPVDGCRIAHLKVGGNLAYDWLEGGCELLGASSKTDASCLACLFVKDALGWRGGKFDWISTSRTTRDFKNIESGYHGWDAQAFKAAKSYAFVIVSKDGKKRTNIITCGR